MVKYKSYIVLLQHHHISLDWLPLQLNFYPFKSKQASKIILPKWNFIKPCFYIYLMQTTRFISYKWLPNVPLGWAQFNLKGATQITLLLVIFYRFEYNPTPSIKSCHKSTHGFGRGKKYTSVATHISIGDMLVDPLWFFLPPVKGRSTLGRINLLLCTYWELFLCPLFYFYFFICIATGNSSTACFYFLNGNIESMTLVKKKKKQFRKLPC